MIDFSKATVDELSVLILALEDANLNHNDLDIPLIRELQDKVKKELSKK